jgi:hypothetical protein
MMIPIDKGNDHQIPGRDQGEILNMSVNGNKSACTGEGISGTADCYKKEF